MTIFKSHALPEFWECYFKLPVEVQRSADKQFEIFQQNPAHPSLQLKLVGDFWSARVTEGYRTLAVREGAVFHWFWIGTHDAYMRLI
jgi:hypothetical protein